MQAVVLRKFVWNLYHVRAQQVFQSLGRAAAAVHSRWVDALTNQTKHGGAGATPFEAKCLTYLIDCHSRRFRGHMDTCFAVGASALVEVRDVSALVDTYLGFVLYTLNRRGDAVSVHQGVDPIAYRHLLDSGRRCGPVDVGCVFTASDFGTCREIRHGYVRLGECETGRFP